MIKLDITYYLGEDDKRKDEVFEFDDNVYRVDENNFRNVVTEYLDTKFGRGKAQLTQIQKSSKNIYQLNRVIEFIDPDSLSAHQGVLGCKRHKKDILIVLNTVKTDNTHYDIFLTKEQALRLNEQLVKALAEGDFV